MHADLGVRSKGKDRFGCLNIKRNDIDTDVREMCRDTNGLNWLIIDSVSDIKTDVRGIMSEYKWIKLAYCRFHVAFAIDVR